MKRFLPLLLLLTTTFGFTQVGVNTTNPDPSSMLDVSATDKGVLVPRVSLFNVTTTMLDGTNTAATGLLIWNTNATTVGGNGVGFYFFNGTQWIPITQSGVADHDWYEVGTTTAPNAITDDMFHTGNVVVGKNTIGFDNPKLSIEESGSGTPSPLKIVNIKDASTSTASHNGIFLEMAATTSAAEYGIVVEHTNPNAPLKYGVHSSVNNGSGTNSSFQGRVSGTGLNIGTSILISDSGSPSNGIQGGFEALFQQPTTSFTRGLNNQFGTNNLALDGGPKYGVYNSFGGPGRNVGGELYGSYNAFDANLTSFYNKYGSFTFIPSTVGGIHYGIYAEVPKSNSYAGYFLGRVSVGTTTANNYIFPSSRGTNGQTMQTDGSGNVTWVNPVVDTDDQTTDVFSLTGSTLNLSLQNDGEATQTVDLSPLKDHDFYEVGGTTAPDSITDNKYTEGSLTIGTNTAATGVLDVDNATKATSVDVTNTYVLNPVGIDVSLTSSNSTKTGVKTTFNGASPTGNNTFISNIDNTTGNSNRTGILQEFNGTSSSIATTIRGLKNDFKSTASYYAVIHGIENNFADNNNSFKYGMTNNFLNGGSSQSTGVLNNFNGTSTGIAYGISNASNNYNGLLYGMQNNFSGTGNNDHFGMFNYFDGTGTGNKYGIYNNFPTTAGGTHYGIYSDVLKSGSYAGYFLGNVSIGTNALNNYVLPPSRGTNGQIMQTDGSGNVSWVNLATNTDDQATDVFSLTGTTLNLSLQNDGVATQTVDLSPLKDHDWYEVGGTTQPNAITDNIYKQGSITIGTNTTATGVLDVDNASKLISLDVNNTFSANPIGVNVEINSTSGTKTGIEINHSGIFAGFGGIGSMIKTTDSSSGNNNRFVMYNVFNGTSTDTNINSFGIRNSFIANSFVGDFIGVDNYENSTSNGDRYGLNNLFAGTGSGTNYGVYNYISGTGSGTKYGVYNTIISSAGGTHYGIYSNVLKAGSYAGYFLGNVSVGTNITNNYVLPPSRGLNGQIMQTDGSGNVSWVNPVVDTDTDDQTTDVFSLTGDILNLSLQNDGVATQTVDLSPLKDHDWYEIGTTTAPNAITDNIFTQGNVAIGKNTIGPDTRVDVDNTNKITSLTLSNSYDVPASESAKYGIYNTLNSVEQQTAIKNDLLGNGSYKAGVDNLFQGIMVNGSASGINTRFETTGGANQFGVYNTFASASSTGTTINGMRNWFQAGSGYTSFLTGIANDFNNNNNGEHTAVANTFTGTGTGTKYGIKNTFSGGSNGIFYGSYTDVTAIGGGVKYGAYNNLNCNGTKYGVYNNLVSSASVAVDYGVYNKINNTGGTVGAHYGVYNEMLAFDNQYGTYTTMPNGSVYPQYGNYITIAGTGTGNRYGFYSTISPFAGGTHYGVYSDATKAGSYAGYFLGNVSIGTSAFNNYILPASRGTNGQIMQTDGSGNVSWTTPSIGGTLDDAYDFGGSGAGKIIVADNGPVAIIGTDGLVSTGNVGNGSLAPSGGGIRMVWNPRKAAFRVGSAYTNYWDDAQIGLGSFATGSITIASGNYAFASGNQSSATGTYSTAMGFLSAATGNNATALSSGNATGDNSFAVGGGLASAAYSTALGLSQASGDYATALGWSNANGLYSLSAGNSSTVGNYSTALGFLNNTASFGETTLGIGSTTYTPSVNGTTQFRVANATDRLLVVGNAIDTNNNGSVDLAERSDALIMLKNGETGLGMNPVTGSRLAVSGKTQTTNFQMTSGAFGGYILQSDATGNASWVNPTTLTPVQWKIGGNSGTISGTDYIGTNDAQDFDFRTNGVLKLRLTQQGQLSFQNTGGSVFVGAGAGNSDDLTANQNTFVGTNSGNLTTTGNLNTAVGHFALDANTTGVGNTAIGRASLATNDLGSNNTALGRLTDVSTGSLTNATVIGYNATVNASNKVRLGSTLVTVVEGQVAYTNPSDARFKFNVKENVPGLDFIKKLKPVTYNFDTKKFENHLNPNRKEEVMDIDYSKSTAIIHTGFLAQDVEKICKDLGYDFDGLHIPDANNPTDNYGVAYSQFIMPIVKAVQEQQVIIENQKTELEQLKSELEKYKSLEERIKALEQK